MAEAMAEKTTLPEKFYEAYKKSYEKLTKALPINDLIPKLYSEGVLPGNLKSRIDTISVPSEKTRLLLDEMEGGLKIGITDQFEGFVRALEQFSLDEKHMVVGILAKDIRLIIGGSSATPPVQPAPPPPVQISASPRSVTSG